MPRINTNQAADFIAELRPFTTNGAIAGTYENGGEYVVKSYSTAIAVLYPDQQRAVINGARYSVTTSRHQHAARVGIGRLGYEETAIDNPEQFTALTGHRARLRGANY